MNQNSLFIVVASPQIQRDRNYAVWFGRSTSVVVGGGFVSDLDDNNEAEHYDIPDDPAACHTGRTAANYGVTITL